MFSLFGRMSASSDPKSACNKLLQSGIAEMRSKNYARSLRLLASAKIIAEKNHWNEELFKATNNIGGNYFQMLDYGEALNQYQQCYKIALKYLGPKYEMIILNNIAVLYCSEKLYLKASINQQEALTIAVKNNDSIKIGFYSVNLANMFNKLKRFDEAKALLIKAKSYFKNLAEGLNMREIILADTETGQGQIKQARTRAERLLKDLRQQKEPRSDMLLETTFIIAKTYYQENNLQSALQWTNRAFEEGPDLEMKHELFELLSRIYADLRSFDQALSYKDSVNATSEKLNEIRNNSLYQSSAVKFQIENYKREIAVKESKIKSDHTFFYSLFGVILIVALLLLVLFLYYNTKIRQKKLIAERDFQKAELQLQKEATDNLLLKEKEKTALLVQERLNDEIELKNQKILSKALYVSGRDELLQEILRSLSKLSNISENKALVSHIRKLKNHLKTDNDWENFILHFEEVNHSFLKNLKNSHPGLTTNDIRYISYVYMNLNTKEISVLLNITIEACKKRKERIMSKLGLSEEKSLIDYLSSF
jgi:tetratricopeptide (TPR) repeat protein